MVAPRAASTYVACLALSGLVAAACSTEHGDPTGALAVAATRAEPEVVHGTHPRFLYMRDPAARLAQTTTPPKMVYYGGPIIESVKVYAVLWGPKVDSTVSSQLPDYFNAIIQSPWFDWLSEYNTPTQTIGRGGFASTYLDMTASTATTITDDQVKT